MKYGIPKAPDEISRQDVLDNYIWVPVWSAALETDYPEDYQVPVLNEDDVDDEIDDPIITLKVEGTGIIGSAELNLETESLESIALWQDDGWVLIQNSELEPPITLISLPSIQGEKDLRFVCHDPMADIARIK